MCSSTLPSIDQGGRFFSRSTIRLRDGETNDISENSKSLDDKLFVLLLIITQHLLTLPTNKELRRDNSSVSFAFNIEALCHPVRTKINRIYKKN